MAYSYPLSLPTVTSIQSISLRAVNAIGLSQSPFTYKQQTVSFSGQRWEADITLPPMNRAAAEEWVAFLLRLKGQLGTFLLSDPSGTTPRGSASTAAGTPLVNGGSQTGGSLSVDGLPASASGYLKQGDYIQLGAASSATLHKVLTDVDSNASGEASIDIWPSIRSAPADDATLTVSSCAGVFRLNSNQTNWNINEAVTYGISFSAVEVIV